MQSLKILIAISKDCHMNLRVKNWKLFIKNVTPRSKDNKNLKEKVLNDVGDLFNELCYIYKDKYSKEINNLNTEDKKKLRLTDNYECYSENEEKQQTSKNFNELNELITRKETDINNELVKKYFFVQDLRYLLINLEKLKNNPEKNKELVIAIKSGL